MKKIIEQKIARIGHIFWEKKNWVGGHNTKAEDVVALSARIKEALK